MPIERIENVVIGAGQAGLAMSHHLRERGAEHVVLERGRVAERWRSERWDSLCFQSPNWNMKLPGWSRTTADPQADPDAFSPLPEVTHYIERYAAKVNAPVRTGCTVHSLTRKPGARALCVQTQDTLYEAHNVVVATGPYQAPRPTLPLRLPLPLLASIVVTVVPAARVAVAPVAVVPAVPAAMVLAVVVIAIRSPRATARR